MPPLSDLRLLKAANDFRGILYQKAIEKVEIIQILELLCNLAILNFLCCEDSEACNKGEAFFDPVTKTIIVPETVYELACCGDGRARFTIAHELAHFFLCHNTCYARNGETEWKTYEDSEWQADTFAGYFLAPPDLVCKYSSPEEVVSAFGLSFSAAQVSLSKAKKVKP